MLQPKKKTTPEKTSTGRGQQLSDKLIRQVTSGKMTYDQASKKQKSQDAKVRKITKVGSQTKGSSQKTASKRTYKKASFKVDRRGDLKAH